MRLFENDAIAVRSASGDETELFRTDPELSRLFSDGEIYAVAGCDGTLYGAIARRRYSQWSMEGISFATLPRHRRSGFAASAVRGFTRWFFDNTAENMLVAVVDLENVAAVRTLERAGYEYIRTTTLAGDKDDDKAVCHLFVCSRATADAGAPPRGCCCGCGGHAE